MTKIFKWAPRIIEESINILDLNLVNILYLSRVSYPRRNEEVKKK